MARKPNRSKSGDPAVSLLDRLFSFFLDWAIWGYIAYGVMYLLNHYWWTVYIAWYGRLILPSWGWPVVVLATFELALLCRACGHSLGMRALGLQLAGAASREDRPKQGHPRLTYLLASHISILPLGLGVWASPRQPWHERLSGLRLAPLPQREEWVAPPPRWYRTNWGLMALVVLGVTVTLGWHITAINIQVLFSEAGKPARLWQGLVTPDFSYLIRNDPWLHDSVVGALIESVFMALLATVFGAGIAFLLSFFGARNIMAGVFSSHLGIFLAFVWLIPLGVPLGWLCAVIGARLSEALGGLAAGVIIILLIGWVISWRVARKRVRLLQTEWARVLSQSAEILLLASLSGSLCGLTTSAGVRLFFLAVGALAGTAAVTLVGDRLLGIALDKVGQRWRERLLGLLGILPGVLIGLIVAATLSFIYFIIVGGKRGPGFHVIELGILALISFVLLILGGIAGWRYVKSRGYDHIIYAGMLAYSVTRGFFNVFRSIEAILWALIFAVWVGWGPFAGTLALFIHTIAALGKLYSEQVEHIDPGPLEATAAAGASWLETIRYAVIPQIVPPYLAFTLYRWDINVRMATVVALVGGGGIGRLFFYYKNERDWPKVGAVIVAIAIVVWALDYISARIRERIA